MNTKQENKLSMYETVLELFSNNPAIVALILAFSNAAKTFTNKVSLLQAPQPGLLETQAFGAVHLQCAVH